MSNINTFSDLRKRKAELKESMAISQASLNTSLSSLKSGSSQDRETSSSGIASFFKKLPPLAYIIPGIVLLFSLRKKWKVLFKVFPLLLRYILPVIIRRR